MGRLVFIRSIHTTFHRYVRVAVFVVLGMIVGASCMHGFLVYQHGQIEKQLQHTATTTALFSRSMPTYLHIPKLKMDVAFEAPLGLHEDNTVEVPDSYEKVGWYKNGATPGEIGSAVILGHVDSYKGPAVFYSLPKLKKGDEIEVQRADGTKAVFTVDELVRYDRDEFPTERVYGKTDTAQLRLVTCTGTFNKGAQQYSHNLVVYASLKQ